MNIITSLLRADNIYDFIIYIPTGKSTGFAGKLFKSSSADKAYVNYTIPYHTVWSIRYADYVS